MRTDRHRTEAEHEPRILFMPAKAHRIPGNLFIVADGMGGHQAGISLPVFVVENLVRVL